MVANEKERKKIIQEMVKPNSGHLMWSLEVVIGDGGQGIGWAKPYPLNYHN